MGSSFGDTDRSLKFAIFGHETWHLAKVPEVAQYNVLLSQGVEIELTFPLFSAVFETHADFQNCHIWV